MLLVKHNSRPNEILSSTDSILINPVNCVGVMGKGLALEFKRKWPHMFDDYQYCCRIGQVYPGTLHIYRLSDKQTIVNLPTKRDWRDPSKLEWVEKGIRAVIDLCKTEDIDTVTWPLLGAGNGGLDSTKVMVLMHNLLDPTPVTHTLYLLD
jgi:O-acetyl-ADP-ribose deacetylase (regulator of RNase III)